MQDREGSNDSDTFFYDITGSDLFSTRIRKLVYKSRGAQEIEKVAESHVVRELGRVFLLFFGKGLLFLFQSFR